MRIIDLTEQHLPSFLRCLGDEWKDARDAGDRKRIWYEKMKNQGLRVKIAQDDSGVLAGFIQYLPVEHSFFDGHDLYTIMCMMVHGSGEGSPGNMRGKGAGEALLRAAEEDVKSLGAKGIVAWGLDADYHMPASWYEKQGYFDVDRKEISRLLWKPFADDAVPPRFFTRELKLPEPIPGKVNVVFFINGWCPAANITYERAKRAAAELGDKVAWQEIDTTERSEFLERGKFEGWFVDGEDVWYGPPKPYEEIKALLAEKVSHLTAATE